MPDDYSLREYAEYGKAILPDPDQQPHGPRGIKRQVLGAAEDPPEERLARFLGVFSLALGTAELLAPRALARLVGLGTGEGLVRLFGAREIASGIGILAGRRPAASVWSRVAGDAMDLSVLLAALVAGRRRGSASIALLVVAGITALDVLCAQQLEAPPTQIGRTRSQARPSS
jgi:hypothetical protein